MTTLNLSDGRTLFYRDVGAGRPLVLLHGFPFTSACFAPQLDAPPPGVRLIVPDLRGFGQSSPGGSTTLMEDFAADTLALMDALTLTDAFVGGVSMGGYVTLAVTRLAPARVRGLVLIDTQPLADDEAGRTRRETTARDAERLGSAVVADAMLPRLFSSSASPAVVGSTLAMMRAQAPAAVAAASRGMALRTDARELLSRFEGPTLIVVGALDVITPPERARSMADLVRGAQLAVIEGAGHLPQLEQPQAFNATLARFFKSLQG